MAKPKKRRKKPGRGQQAPPAGALAMLGEIESLRTSLEEQGDGAAWGAMQKLLLNSGADSNQVARAVMGRDLPTLDAIIARLKGEEPAAPPTPDTPDEPLPDFPGDQLRDAMKAFKKRLKLTKLDHESKLGRSPLSAGKDAAFDSILPPRKFPPEIWKVLVARGELAEQGHGFYMLPKEPPSLRKS